MLKGHFRKLLVTQPKAAEKTCDLEFNSSDFMSWNGNKGISTLLKSLLYCRLYATVPSSAEDPLTHTCNMKYDYHLYSGEDSKIH